jgi:hypothetical protein
VLDRVNLFGHELTEKRGVKLDSFLFDDGWDNHKSLWKFNDGFPNGFASVKRLRRSTAPVRAYGYRPGAATPTRRKSGLSSEQPLGTRPSKTDMLFLARSIMLPSGMSAWI